jgi:hypothetical protein
VERLVESVDVWKSEYQTDLTNLNIREMEELKGGKKTQQEVVTFPNIYDNNNKY